MRGMMGRTPAAGNFRLSGENRLRPDGSSAEDISKAEPDSLNDPALCGTEFFDLSAIIDFFRVEVMVHQPAFCRLLPAGTRPAVVAVRID